MENNHVLNDNDSQKITLSINNERKDIIINKGRTKFTSEKFDTKIIEIKEEMEL